MTKGRIAAAASIGLFLLATSVLHADVKTSEKSTFKLEGALGKIINFFSRTAREGVTSTVALRGDRKMSVSGDNGTIVDLAEDKVYTLDMKRKNYKVETFEEIRKRMEEARKKAEADAAKARAEEEKKPQTTTASKQDEPQLEIEVDVKRTGQKQTVNGFDSEQVVTTITAHEKGKTLAESGGLVMTADSWLTPTVPALKEIVDFDYRYAQKLASALLGGASPEDAAAAAAMYPGLKDISIRMNSEQAKLNGVPIKTTMTMESVASAEQIREQAKAEPEKKEDAPPSTIGGALGGLAGRFGRKKSEDQPAAAPQQPGHVRILTSTHEILSVSTSVADADLAIPAGFKLNK